MIRSGIAAASDSLQIFVAHQLHSSASMAAAVISSTRAKLHREAAPLFAQSQSIATLLEKRLDYLHKSDAEMATLVRELTQTKPYKALTPTTKVLVCQSAARRHQSALLTRCAICTKLAPTRSDRRLELPQLDHSQLAP